MLNVETRAGRRSTNSERSNGPKALREGYDQHMSDATKLARQAWDSVSPLVISRCWISADCLPTAINAELNSQYGRIRDKTRSDTDFAEILSMVAKLKIKDNEQDSTSAIMQAVIKENDVEK